MNNVIKKYASTITKEQIVSYALKENVKITQEEVNIIYNSIKNDIDILLSENSISYLNSQKSNLSKELYTKILELYNKYKVYLKN
ncbi:MAG: hypothetical protein RR984_03205 [Bacilli bacterium]